MPEATVVVREVTTKSGVSQKSGKPWTKFEVVTDDAKYGTFESALADHVRGYIGKAAIIGFEQNGNFFNLSTIREAPAGSVPTDEPKLGTGDYVKGKTAPDDQRAINARKALDLAVAALTHTVKTDQTPKDVADRIQPLASSFLLWLTTNSAPFDDDSIPF